MREFPPPLQGRKNSININFLVRISRGHSRPLRPDAPGSKSFSPPPGPQEHALFGADVHDFRCGRPRPEGLSKNFVQKKFALIFWPLPPLLSRNFGEFGRNQENLGKVGGNSAEFSGVLHGASFEFSGNSWAISGATPGFEGKSGVGEGSANTGFAQIGILRRRKQRTTQAAKLTICCSAFSRQDRQSPVAGMQRAQSTLVSHSMHNCTWNECCTNECQPCPSFRWFFEFLG